MKITLETLQEFTRLSKFDLASYFQSCQFFFTNDFNRISSYYKGEIDSINSGPFKRYDLLKIQTKKAFESFQLIKSQLNNYKWWLILEQVEEIDSRLMTLGNINRWARSSIKNFGYSSNPEFTYVLSQNQTLERISKDIIKSQTPEDDWFDIAFRNSIIEEDYTPEGGNILKLEISKQVINFEITSVVDIIDGKSIYGKDVKKQLEFEDDDLVVLNFDDTLRQAVEILINLKKGDNPDFPEAGLQRSILVGSNRATFNFPIITRQLNEIFNSDDSLKNFIINNISFDQDNVQIDFSVQSRLGEVFSQSSILK